jgi:hypothetical protein
MAKNSENLISGGLHEKRAVQRGVWVPTEHCRCQYEYIRIHSVPRRKDITSSLQRSAGSCCLGNNPRSL